MKVSICIPCYEMGGNGPMLLGECLNSILIQRYQNIEVIISDDSKDPNLIYDVYLKFRDLIKDIKYFSNADSIGKASANLNNAIRKSSGDIIKILFQDDLLYSELSIGYIVDSFLKNPNEKWIATSCCHTSNGQTTYNHRNPSVTDNILEGNNQIGSPSVIAFTRECSEVEFDPEFNWLMDCDFYYRMIKSKGGPKLIYITTVVIRRWSGQMTEVIETADKNKEHERIMMKYGI